MASCQTTRWVSTAPYVRLVVNENKSTSTATVSKLDWALYYISDTPAKASARTYTVKINGSVPTNGSGSYNINGVTGTKKITGGTVSVNKSSNSKSVSFFVSFSFELSWSGHYQDTLTASGKINIPAITSYTIAYNANGGINAPPAQTKRHGSSITISSAKPDRDGYIFQGWSDSTSGNVKYHPGDTYSQNGNATLYAIWQQATFTIYYDANGGTYPPGNQTKNYGKDIKLRSDIPSRKGYGFLGWGVTANDPSVVYKAGDNYTSNASITLYAVWKFTYTNPRIKNVITNRCTMTVDENNMIVIPGLHNITLPKIIITPSDGGELGSICFDWETDYPTKSVTIRYKMQTSSEWTIATFTDTNTDANIIFNEDKKGGTSNFVIETDDPYASYAVQIEVKDDFKVKDDFGSSRISRILPGLIYTMDFADGGKSVGIGCVAPDVANGEPGVLEVGFKTKLTGGIQNEILSQGSDLNDVITPNTYASLTISDNTYTNLPSEVTSGEFILDVTSAGSNGQICQRLTTTDKTEPKIFTRFYYENSWGEWVKDNGGLLSISTANATYQKKHSQKILWSDTPLYMKEGQTITLSEKISKQDHGIVLSFSRYEAGQSGKPGKPLDYAWSNFFIPIQFVKDHPGNGATFIMIQSAFTFIASKYLYIYDDKIIGHMENDDSGTKNGITYDNSAFVLRAVYGV